MSKAFKIPVLMLALLMIGCASRTLEVSPPGSLAPAQPWAETHRVILIHGFGTYPAQLSRLWLAAVNLLPADCEVYTLTGIDPLMGIFEELGPLENVTAMEDFLAAQDIPFENLHLVGHSMGGLLARAFAGEHPEAVRQVFMLGTPSGGVTMLGGLKTEGWCAPDGVHLFNERYPPLSGVNYYVMAGAAYTKPLTGAFWEGVPNDGIVGTESVLSFVGLCPDSVFCEAEMLPLTHPDLNWGENLLDSPRVIGWVLDRILADLDQDGATTHDRRSGD